MTKTKHELLCRYSEFVLKKVGRDETTAFILRNQSHLLLDVIAYVATYNECTVQDIRNLISTGGLRRYKIRYDWLSSLGRALALLGFQKQELRVQTDLVRFGLKCLIFGNKQLPKNRENKPFHKLEVELLAGEGRIREARKRILRNKYLKDEYHAYLLSDLSNVALCGTKSEYGQWLEGFNAPFIKNDLMPVSPSDSFIHSFDELKTEPVIARDLGPKVSIIMTSYNPDPVGFRLSVRSILEQTWQNFELIIVDDASSEEFRKDLTYVANMDDRIKVITLSKNQGTYKARNKGIEAATGDYITGQDSDDWSHPERIANQMDALMDYPGSSGVVVQAIRMDDNLLRISPGRSPERVCEISLLVSIDMARKMGGYLESRKGADSEFRVRLERFTGKQIRRIKKPLYLTRLSNDSLSRADFKPGWSHPVRRAFWNACQYWHRTTQAPLLSLSACNSSPIPIPERFRVSPLNNTRHFDLIFIGDWRAYDMPQQMMIEEIKEHLLLNRRIGILQLETVLCSVQKSTRLCPEIQSLIHENEVSEVISDENARTNTIIIRDPSTLQFASSEHVNLVAGMTIIHPSVACDQDGNTDLWYIPRECQEHAKKLFRGEVLWKPTG